LALMALGRVDEALAAYRQALAFDPDYGEAHNDLGVALVYRRQFAEARSHFERAVRAAPDNREYRSNLQTCPR
jgi:Flp pilus assembly protein TadD